MAPVSFSATLASRTTMTGGASPREEMTETKREKQREQEAAAPDHPQHDWKDREEEREGQPMCQGHILMSVAGYRLELTCEPRRLDIKRPNRDPGGATHAQLQNSSA